MKRILIVEDDKFYSSTLSLKLSKEGFEISLASDGEAAIKSINKNPPDLVLLDLVMPVKDGFDVLKEIRSAENTKMVKVVVLTNLSQDEDRKKATDLGVIDYLVKTNLSIKEMVEKIKSY